MAEEVQAVSRVTSYPLISDSWAKLTKVYRETKDNYAVIRLGCNVAESSLHAAVHVAGPILRRLDSPVVNNIACQQLDKLETAFPLITKPTDVVLDEAKALLTKTVQPTVDSVKHKVNSVKELEEKVVGGIKSYTASAVENAKSYSIARINGLASAAGLNKVLDVAESVLDSYMPAEQGEPRAAEDSAVVQEERLMPLDRVRVVSQKVKQRAYDRAMLRLHGLQLRSTETLKKLSFTIDLIEYAKENLDATSERVHLKAQEVGSKLRSLCGQIYLPSAETDGQTAETTSQVTALDQKVLKAARAFSVRAQSALRHVSDFATVLPASAMNQIRELEQLSKNLYNNLTKAKGLKEVSAELLQAVKEKTRMVLDFSSRLTDMATAQAAAFVDIEKAINWMGLASAKSSPRPLDTASSTISEDSDESSGSEYEESTTATAVEGQP